MSSKKLLPSAYITDGNEQKMKLCDRLWADADVLPDAIEPSFARFERLHWVDVHLVQLVAYLWDPKVREDMTGGLPAELGGGLRGDDLDKATRFFTSALLGHVASPAQIDDLNTWLWSEVPPHVGEGIYVARAREALREMVHRNTRIDPDGVRWGAAQRAYTGEVEHRAPNGAPTFPGAPFRIEHRLRRVPW